MIDSNYAGGRFEPATIPQASPGMAIGGRCDQCQTNGYSARVRRRITLGSLRGMSGMVCPACRDAIDAARAAGGGQCRK